MFFEYRQIIDSDIELKHPTTIIVSKLDDVGLDNEMIDLMRLKGYLKSRGNLTAAETVHV